MVSALGKLKSMTTMLNRPILFNHVAAVPVNPNATRRLHYLLLTAGAADIGMISADIGMSGAVDCQNIFQADKTGSNSILAQRIHVFLIPRHVDSHKMAASKQLRTRVQLNGVFFPLSCPRLWFR